MEPVMKWAGGKRQILSQLKELMPSELLEGHTYYEPFVGGGSVFMALAHNRVVINDSNAELINVYEQIKVAPDQIVVLLKEHERLHSKEYYYSVREWDRQSSFSSLSAVERAARTIYLNRTCFNGLYRVNRRGHFNVPLGSYKSPQIVRENQIREVSNYLNSNDICIRCGDFEKAVAEAQAGDVVYFDPPYDYDDDTSEGFVRYTADQFSRETLVRLEALCDYLISKGCHVIVSNNDTPFVNEVFSPKKYDYIRIIGRRMINNMSDKRRGVDEVILVGRK